LLKEKIMPFLKKVAKAVASGSPVAAGKSSGMFGGAISKAMPKIKEAVERGAAAPAAAVKGRGRSGLGGMLSGSYTATAKAGASNPSGRSGLMGGAIRKAAGNMRFNEGGMASDKAGRALGKKTADAKGRAMATTPMKKGGMAKKSSKK
jgi:hypothetical protein